MSYGLRLFFSIEPIVFPQSENRYDVEMEDHKNKLDKEYENLMTGFQRELEQLQQKCLKELEKKVMFFRDID